jgi:hypothetical protein
MPALASQPDLPRPAARRGRGCPVRLAAITYQAEAWRAALPDPGEVDLLRNDPFLACLATRKGLSCSALDHCGDWISNDRVRLR